MFFFSFLPCCIHAAILDFTVGGKVVFMLKVQNGEGLKKKRVLEAASWV